MKIPQIFRHKKLLATAARRASATSGGIDFDDIPEPNMKLSRALLIVLLLHVVAVSGIIAFNAIKTHETSFVPPSTDTEKNMAETAATPVRADVAKARAVAPQKQSAPRNDAKPSHSPAREEHARTSPSSGKTYIVKKGDNPVTIAKKLNVAYDDLISLNHIEDPHKLQIGQKLLIPAKATKTKTKKANR